MNKAEDFLGNEIHTGCTVVYPVRKGSRMWLSKLQVTKIKQVPGEKPAIVGVNGKGSVVTVINLQNCIVVER